MGAGGVRTGDGKQKQILTAEFQINKLEIKFCTSTAKTPALFKSFMQSFFLHYVSAKKLQIVDINFIIFFHLFFF